MSIYNEYDKLKTVMIGQAFSSEIMFDLYGETDHTKHYGRINEEANEDLDILENSFVYNYQKEDLFFGANLHGTERTSINIFGNPLIVSVIVAFVSIYKLTPIITRKLEKNCAGIREK